MPNALILGANAATGAYLARLVQARGTAVFAVRDDSDADCMTALGITDDVNPVPAADAVALAATLADATIFAVNTGSDAQADLVASVLAAATSARLCHIVDAEVLRHHPRLLDQARTIAALRRDDGRPAVNAILHAHDSRLGDPDSLPARIAVAAFRAGQGAAPAGIEIAETGPRDWGWTAEYVDAIARLAALETPLDLAIGSGHMLTTQDFVDHAFAFFKASPDGHVRVTAAPVASPLPVDTARLKAATSWSASTYGRDLVRALCEGAAARAG